jgi:hypothetical protein
VSKEDAGLYVVERVEVPAISDEAQISRFLMQSTFGTTRASIGELTSQYGGDVEQWMKGQVALPATLLRTYLRERTNPRARQGSGLRAACDAGSRWLAFTFDRMDVGKMLVVTAAQESGRFSLVIDGVQRGEVTLDGVAWSKDAASSTYVICSVTEAVGGEVLISSTEACKITTARVNPALALSGTTAVVILASPFTFVAVQDVPGAYVLQKPPRGCSLRDGRDSYISVGGTLYRHDPRVRLLENTVEAPAATIAASGTCPAVSRTFVNAGGCVRRPSCAPLTFTSASLILDEGTLRRWYTKSQRFVYYVTNLTLTAPFDVSACVGVSRWQQTAGACIAPTILDPGTQASVTIALRDSTDVNPNVRDISIEVTLTHHNRYSVTPSQSLYHTISITLGYLHCQKPRCRSASHYGRPLLGACAFRPLQCV